MLLAEGLTSVHFTCSSESRNIQAQHACVKNASVATLVCYVQGSTQAEPQGKKCRVGHMCPMGSTFEIPCRPVSIIDRPCSAELFRGSTYRDSEAKYLPMYCGTPESKGTYQDMEGSTFCNPCAGGYYCPMGADRSFDAKYICPKGSFCPRGSNHAKEYLCPPGGQKFDGSLHATRGRYTLQVSYKLFLRAFTLVRLGFYNPKEGIASVLSCLPCPPGKYCGSAGLAEPSGDCAEGFYCSGGARYPNEVLNGKP